MRVTIEHREESAGLTGTKRNRFVDCAVEFSQEELAIIKARGLQDRGFAMPAATPLPTAVTYVGSGVVRSIGRLLIVAGVVYGIVAGLAGWHGDGLSVFMLLIGIGLEVYGWRKSRAQEQRLDSPDQMITLGHLISQGRFTVYAFDPSHAKGIEDDIRSSLAGMKQLLQDAAEIKAKQTFEL
jgi:hypothetical protein